MNSDDADVVKIRGQSLLAAWTARPQKDPPSKRTPLSSFDKVLVETPKRPSSVTAIIEVFQLTYWRKNYKIHIKKLFGYLSIHWMYVGNELGKTGHYWQVLYSAFHANISNNNKKLFVI